MALTKKGMETRLRILAAALELFGSNGFNGTTTKEIAVRAGVAEGTLFRYFNNKKELLEHILEPILVHTAQQLQAQSEHLPLAEALEYVIKNRLSLVENNWALFKVVFFEAGFQEEIRNQLIQRIVFPMQQEIKEFLLRRMEKGEIKGANPYLIMQMFGGIVVSTLVYRMVIKPIQAWHQVSDDQLLREIIDLFLQGVAADA
ncbi:MAG TPA: TetR/AcrR family transcriptional regulator [Bacillota bacterium]|nr:TetR/AcrR family transcriptional regulator [Bacillota bacterium]